MDSQGFQLMKADDFREALFSSVKNISVLVEGGGDFAPFGEDVFDDYWRNYLTRDMARAIESEVPYRNLEEYWEWRNR